MTTLLSVCTAVEVMFVDMSDIDWLTDDMVEEVEQDVVGISGTTKLAGVFNRRGEWGDKGVFDSWFKSCWFSINTSVVISGRSGCSITGG